MTRLYRIAVLCFAALFIAIGFTMLFVTALHGGGFVGFVLGALFIAAGSGRIYLLRHGR